MAREENGERRRRRLRSARGKQRKADEERKSDDPSHTSSIGATRRGRSRARLRTYFGAGPGGESGEEAFESPALGGQEVLDMRRSRVSHLAPQNAGALELAEALRQRGGRDRPERVAELGEARASVVRRVDDRDGVTTFEDVRRATDVLGNQLPSSTAWHWTAPARPRVRAPAPRRWTSPGGRRSPRARSPGCPRDRRDCAPG